MRSWCRSPGWSCSGSPTTTATAGRSAARRLLYLGRYRRGGGVVPLGEGVSDHRRPRPRREDREARRLLHLVRFRRGGGVGLLGGAVPDHHGGKTGGTATAPPRKCSGAVSVPVPWVELLRITDGHGYGVPVNSGITLNLESCHAATAGPCRHALEGQDLHPGRVFPILQGRSAARRLLHLGKVPAWCWCRSPG